MLEYAYAAGMEKAFEDAGITKKSQAGALVKAVPRALGAVGAVGRGITLNIKNPRVYKALEWAMRHPLASRTLAGATVGGIGGGLFGDKGGFVRGALAGAGLGAGLHFGGQLARRLGLQTVNRYGREVVPALYPILGGVLGTAGAYGLGRSLVPVPQQPWYHNVIPGLRY